MKVHHLDCGSMRPYCERLIHGHGSWIAKGRMVAHCLVIESSAGLVLVDSGIGLEDIAHPERRLGKTFVAVTRPTLDPHQTARRQIEALGMKASDVRHIVVTHLDLDHAGGLSDFPDAQVHVYRAEHEAAMSPTGRLKLRYRPAQWAHGPKWVVHDTDGERFFGLERVRAIVEPEVLLVPTLGHSPGHAAVAVDTGEGWQLHCGDAYFNQHEMIEPPRCPPGLAAFQRVVAHDNPARLDNQRRLRQLRREHEELRLFSAHDPDELAAFTEGA